MRKLNDESRTSTVEDVEAFWSRRAGGTLGRWQFVTHGFRARKAILSAYAVDTVALPEENPFKAWMRRRRRSIFSPTAAQRSQPLAVMSGSFPDWTIHPANEVKWKRFATGLYEPLGLKIVNDQIYVLGRDQITRLYDFNNDGEADFYENFCNAWVASPAPHGFNLDLQVDSAGNFYFGNCGNSAPLNVRMQQSLLKVSKYGETCEVFATGLRAPNGFGMGPHDELVCSDNQGHWTPVCRINLAKKDGFFGFVADPARSKHEPNLKMPETFDPPICWIPMNIDNSTGGQVWAPEKWGPMSGQLLSTSYGMSALYEVLWEEVGGVAQGGVIKLPFKFDSGIMRARVNPKDGQVWVTGMKGWQTNAPRDGCLQRVRATGKPAHMPVMRFISEGTPSPLVLAIRWMRSLPATSNPMASSNGTIAGQPTTARPTSSRATPRPPAMMKWRSNPSRLSADHKTVTLQIPGLKPVMQMMIQMHPAAADGTAIDWEIDNTINKLP